MSINSFTIRGYQSHIDTHLELSGLTVIVGPSNTGKSAITRAFVALASNQTGKDFITHGQQTCQISATTDKGTITLTKGKPEDSYYITYADDPKNPKKFTKLGVTAPQEVSDFLGIPSKDAVNFAAQWDGPFLLKSSATDVARVLGELTNVSAVFGASRESLRRKSGFSSTLKVREVDLDSLTAASVKFEDLPAREEAIDEAERLFEQAKKVQEKLSRLADLVSTLKMAGARMKTAQAATTAPLPDTSAAVELYNKKSRLDELVRELSTAQKKYSEASNSAVELTQTLEDIEIEYVAVLHEAGTCPTCGQDTEGVHTHVMEK